MNFKMYKDMIIEDLTNIIRYQSILESESATIGKPFGVEINNCLDETLKICLKLGFKTHKDPDGYYGYAEWGQGDEYIALLCHLDVVPVGDISLWNTPPFQATLIGDEIYGRGTSDDKGPTICAIYAVKAIMDSNIPLKKRIRIVFGLDEETLWRCMDEYKKKEAEPICAIVTDGAFPFIFAEKGILQVELIKKTNKNDVIINGGKNYNSVALDAYYSGGLISEIIKEIDGKFHYEIQGDTIKLIGTPSHAAIPERGKNAILYLASVLRNLGVKSDLIEFLTSIFNYNYEQTKLFSDNIEDESGKITVNLGAIEMDEEHTKLKVDIRIPVTFQKTEIIKKIIQRIAPYNFTLNIFSYQEPLLAPLDSEFAQTLLTTYQKLTNDYTSPLSSGGGTFARVFSRNSVCFGPHFIGSLNNVHGPNEKVNIEALLKALEIYYQTLIRLNESDIL